MFDDIFFPYTADKYREAPLVEQRPQRPHSPPPARSARSCCWRVRPRGGSFADFFGGMTGALRSARVPDEPESGRRDAPELGSGVPQVDAGADDDLVAFGPHPLDGACARDGGARLAPALPRGPLGLDGFDLAGCERAIALDHVAVVIEASPEQVNQKGLGIAMEHPACAHGVSSPRRWLSTAGALSVAPPPPPRSRPTPRSRRRTGAGRRESDEEAVAPGGRHLTRCRPGLSWSGKRRDIRPWRR